MTITSLRDDVSALSTRMATAEAKPSPEELKPLDEFIQSLRNFSPSSAVSSDSHTARILPMAAQRSVSGQMTKMLEQLCDGMIQVSSIVRGLCKDSVRSNSVATQAVQQLLTKLVSLFENVRQPILGTGKISFDILEQWFSQYKSCLVSEATDTLDLSPSNEASIVESCEEVIVYRAPPPPETEDFSEQAGRGFLNFQVRSLSAQASVEVRSVLVATDMVLGTGAGSEQSGFVSKERVQKLEEHYKSQITTAQKQLVTAERIARLFAARLRSSEIQTMASQDSLSKHRAALAVANQENAALKRKASVMDTATETTPMISHPISTQIYFPEVDEGRFLQMPNRVVDGECCLEYFARPPPKALHFANIFVQATAETVDAGGDAPVLSLRNTSSATDLDLKDISDLENKKAAASSLPTIIPLKHSNLQTDNVFVYCENMVDALQHAREEADLRVAQERSRCELGLKARDDLLQSKEAAAALTALQIEEEKQYVQEQTAKLNVELAELARRRAALDNEQREHQQWLDEQAHAVAEKGSELERTDQERQRKALVLHAHVSDMQTGFEAIDASVVRYKFLDKENSDLRKELEQEREKLSLLQQQLLVRRASARGGSATTAPRESIQLDSIITLMTKNPQREEDLMETLKEAQKRMKQLQRERDDFRIKCEGERQRSMDLEKQLSLQSGAPAASTFSIGRASQAADDSKKDEQQMAAKQLAGLKAEIVQLKASLAACEKSKVDLRTSCDSSVHEVEIALDKACIEKKHLKKDLESLRIERDSQISELQRQMESNERVLLEELDKLKGDLAQMHGSLGESTNMNITFQKENKKLLQEIDSLESIRMSSQFIGVVGKRMDSAYRHMLSIHWKVLEVSGNIRKFLAVAAAPSFCADIGSRVANLLATGGVTDDDLGEAVRKMANEDLEQLSSLSNCVRSFSERHHSKPVHSPRGATSPRPLSGMTPWNGSQTDHRATPPRSRERLPGVGGKVANDWFGDPPYRSGTPPRAAERLVEVLASIPDQPAITIPAGRALLQPLDLSVQPPHRSSHPSAAANGTSPPPLPSRQLSHVIHDGMPKRVGSSHQALAGKHRQIIQSRNVRDL